MSHGCNLYCRPAEGLHADVVYAAVDLDQYPDGWRSTVTGMLRHNHHPDAVVVSIDTAPEAPERGRYGIGPYRKLVRWREPIVQVETEDGWVTIPGITSIRFELS